MCEAAIMSLRKHGGKDYRVIVFDNSTDVDYPATEQMAAMKMCARPFTRKMEGVEIIDNTKGQGNRHRRRTGKIPQSELTVCK